MKNAILFCCFILGVYTLATDKISGKVVQGYRVLDITSATSQINFVVYRGDYIKFEHGHDSAHLKIIELKVEQDLPKSIGDAPYFKMKNAGVYNYVLGSISGQISVIEFEGHGYRELTADQSETFIKDISPLILDVRTSGEYRRAHIKGAMLLPVQELQSRFSELEKFKNQDILIYCATGNRSTVASKILLDKGYKSIANMRYGIKDWMSKKKPIEK